MAGSQALIEDRLVRLHSKIHRAHLGRLVIHPAERKAIEDGPAWRPSDSDRFRLEVSFKLEGRVRTDVTAHFTARARIHLYRKDGGTRIAVQGFGFSEGSTPQRSNWSSPCAARVIG